MAKNGGKANSMRVLAIAYIIIFGIIGLAIIGLLGGFPIYNSNLFWALSATDKFFSVFISVIFSCIGVGYIVAGPLVYCALRKT